MGKRTASAVLLGIILGLVIAFSVAFAHGETTNRKNSLGVTETYSNQMSYMFGAVLHSDEIGGRVTNVVFQPYGSSLIYTEPILFCGDQTRFFPTGQMVIATYRRTATRMYREVACHDVYKVVALELPEARD